MAIEPARGLGKRRREDGAQPRRQLGMRPAAKLGELFVRDQERLLDDVRRVEPAAQPRVDLKPSQQTQIIGVLLDARG